MEKMFQGIAAAYSSATACGTSTQSIFEEFKLAAAASAATTTTTVPTGATGDSPALPTSQLRSKAPVVCTPEEKKELELFERVEAEIDRLGDDEEEAVSLLYGVIRNIYFSAFLFSFS